MGKAEPRPSRFDDAVAWAAHAIVANPRVCWWVLGVMTVTAVMGRLGSGGEWVVFTGVLGGALLARRDPPVAFRTEPVVIVAVMLLLSLALGLLIWLTTLGGSLLWHSVSDDPPAPFMTDPATPLIHMAFTVANCLLVVAAVRSVASLRRFVATGFVLAGAAALGAWAVLEDPILAVTPVVSLAASFVAAIPFVLCTRAVASMTAVPVEHPSIADWDTDPLLDHSSSRAGTSS